MAKKKSKKTGKKSKKTARPFSLVGFTLKWLFVGGLWAGILLGGVIAWYAAELPSITKNATFERKASITVKAADGSVLARYGDIVGDTIEFSDLPPQLVYAVMSIEDRRFYSHPGMDFLGIARAMVVNLREGRFVQGGSTITQQLAKNLFLSKERTLKRKIQEALLAFWLEQQYTKDEIMASYLNRVYFGSGTYGVDAAARLYFKKPVKELTLRECATLAGLLKAPSRYSPLQNPELSRERTDVVLHAMVDAGYIKKSQVDEIENQQQPLLQNPGHANSARYFTDWIVDGLDDLVGTPTEDLVVETTLNPAIQQVAEESLTAAISEHGEERKFTQGAVVVMRPDGTVLAMVGGYDYNQSQFNRAVQAKRQPGSSFKPVVYLTALEHGWSPDDVLIDEPIKTGRYRPENFGGKYYGEITLANALALSLNTVSYQLIKDVGPDAVIDMARRLGIYSPLERDLSIGLGSGAVSLLELSTAYAVLSNGGYAVFPYAITRIVDDNGELYYQRPAYRTTRRVVDEGTVRTLGAMMQNVIQFGTGQAAALPWPASGKTGTSQDSRDAWFMGFTDEMVAGVWIGNDDNSPMKSVTGGSFPARIWRDVMLKGHGRYGAFSASGEFYNSGFQDLLSRLVSPGNAASESYLRFERNRREEYDVQKNTHENSRRYND